MASCQLRILSRPGTRHQCCRFHVHASAHGSRRSIGVSPFNGPRSGGISGNGRSTKGSNSSTNGGCSRGSRDRIYGVKFTAAVPRVGGKGGESIRTCGAHQRRASASTTCASAQRGDVALGASKLPQPFAAEGRELPNRLALDLECHSTSAEEQKRGADERGRRQKHFSSHENLSSHESPALGQRGKISTRQNESDSHEFAEDRSELVRKEFHRRRKSSRSSFGVQANVNNVWRRLDDAELAMAAELAAGGGATVKGAEAGKHQNGHSRSLTGELGIGSEGRRQRDAAAAYGSESEEVVGVTAALTEQPTGVAAAASTVVAAEAAGGHEGAQFQKRTKRRLRVRALESLHSHGGAEEGARAGGGARSQEQLQKDWHAAVASYQQWLADAALTSVGEDTSANRADASERGGADLSRSDGAHPSGSGASRQGTERDHHSTTQLAAVKDDQHEKHQHELSSAQRQQQAKSLRQQQMKRLQALWLQLLRSKSWDGVPLLLQQSRSACFVMRDIALLQALMEWLVRDGRASLAVDVLRYYCTNIGGSGSSSSSNSSSCSSSSSSSSSCGSSSNNGLLKANSSLSELGALSSTEEIEREPLQRADLINVLEGEDAVDIERIRNGNIDSADGSLDKSDRRREAASEPSSRVMRTLMLSLQAGGECDAAVEALDVLVAAGVRDPLPLNCTLGVLTRAGRHREALALVDRFNLGARSSARSWNQDRNAVPSDLKERGLKGVGRPTSLANLKEGSRGERRTEGVGREGALSGSIVPDGFTVTAVMTVLGKAGRLEEAAAMLEDLEEQVLLQQQQLDEEQQQQRQLQQQEGLDGSPTSESTRQAHSSTRKTDFSSRLTNSSTFSSSPTPSAVVAGYTTMLALYERAGRVDEAMATYARMRRHGARGWLDQPAFRAALGLLGRAGRVEEAEELLLEMKACGAALDMGMRAGVVRMYGRAGRLGCVADVLVDTDVPDSMTGSVPEDLASAVLMAAKVAVIRAAKFSRERDMEAQRKLLLSRHRSRSAVNPSAASVVAATMAQRQQEALKAAWEHRARARGEAAEREVLEQVERVIGELRRLGWTPESEGEMEKCAALMGPLLHFVSPSTPLPDSILWLYEELMPSNKKASKSNFRSSSTSTSSSSSSIAGVIEDEKSGTHPGVVLQTEAASPSNDRTSTSAPRTTTTAASVVNRAVRSPSSSFAIPAATTASASVCPDGAFKARYEDSSRSSGRTKPTLVVARMGKQSSSSSINDVTSNSSSNSSSSSNTGTADYLWFVSIMRHKRAGRYAEVAAAYDAMAQSNPAVVASARQTTLCAAMEAFGELRRLERAEEVLRVILERGEFPDLVTSNAMMNACALSGSADRATELFRTMESEWGVQPDVRSHTVLLKALWKAKGLEATSSNSSSSVRSSSFLEIPRGSAISTSNGNNSTSGSGGSNGTSSSSSCSSGSSAQRSGNESSSSGSCSSSSRGAEAVAVYREMQQRGFDLDAIAYNTIINTCGEHLPVEEVVMLYRTMRRSNLRPNAITSNLVLQLLARAGRMDAVEELFDELASSNEADAFTFSTMADAYGKRRQLERMEAVVGEASAARLVSLPLLNACMDAYGKAGLFASMENGLLRLRSFGISPNHTTFNIMVHAYGMTGMVAEMEGVLQRMRRAGLSADTVTFNILIAAYGEADMPYASVKALQDMQEAGLMPDAITYANLIAAFERAGDYFEAARWSLWAQQQQQQQQEQQQQQQQKKKQQQQQQ